MVSYSVIPLIKTASYPVLLLAKMTSYPVLLLVKKASYPVLLLVAMTYVCSLSLTKGIFKEMVYEFRDAVLGFTSNTVSNRAVMTRLVTRLGEQVIVYILYQTTVAQLFKWQI